MGNIFHAEPVAIAAAIRAVILCAVAFGWKATGDQIAAVMLAVEAILAIVLRQTVVAPQTLRDAGTSRQEVKAEAERRTGTGDGGAPKP